MNPVSIVIITRNEERNIGDCLESLKLLDYPRYEIIVIDSSTDKTPEIARKHGAGLVRCRKRGFAHARNLGVKNSRYGIIAFTDADCIIPPHWLKRLVRGFKGKLVAGVGGNAYPPPDSNPIGFYIACLGFPAGGAVGLDAIGKNPSTCNAAFRKEVIREVGGFDERLVYGGEDTDLSERIRRSGYELKYQPECFIYHKTRTGKDFLRWSYRRGISKSHKSRSLMNLLLPVSVLAFPFTKRFRLLVKRRNRIKINILSIFTLVLMLFFIKQICIFIGWLHGVGKSDKG